MDGTSVYDDPGEPAPKFVMDLNGFAMMVRVCQCEGESQVGARPEMLAGARHRRR